MQLSKNFSVAEFTASATAKSRKIDNTIPADKWADAVLTAEMMERIRAHLSQLAGRTIPISINSAWRCPELNRAIGSSNGSDHVKMAAVDFEASVFGSPYQIAKALLPALDPLGVGQIIYENFGGDGWVHCSRIKPAKTVNRVITITPHGTQAGIQTA